MALTRQKKKEVIEDVTGALGAAQVLILVHNKGMTVAEVSDLRVKMREAGAAYKVAKNRLVNLAVKGTNFEQLSNQLKGPTGLAYSQDPVAAAKVVVNFAKTNERLVILGGAFGERQLSLQDVEALAKMPSLDELRGKIIGLLQAPAQKILGVLQAPGGQVARVIAAHASKGE